jgi:two-component system response regulator FlrC
MNRLRSSASVIRRPIQDLYYRLHVFEIRLPALRQRPEDILPLSELFLADLGRSFARPPAGITREARRCLLEHSWPDNVRELRNVLERAAIVCEGGVIVPQHLALSVDDGAAASRQRTVPTSRPSSGS